MANKMDRLAKLRQDLVSGVATKDQAMEFYHLNQQLGNNLGPDLEELILQVCIQAEPEREDLLRRYRHVLRAQGKACPIELDLQLREYDLHEERHTDYQQESIAYEEKCNLSDMGDDFLALFNACRSYSMTSAERMFAVYQATNYIIRAEIQGAFVECGVWRGGSIMMVARTLLNADVTDRDLYLFDTFEGLPKPDAEKDIDIWGNKAIDGWLPRSEGDQASSWAYASQEEVANNLVSTGYPPSRIHLVKGMVEDTIPRESPNSLAFLRLDTDWYASTKHELEYLFPLLVPGGVLIVDDYGHFKGSRQATDEYFEKSAVKGLFNRIDYTGRLMVKPPSLFPNM